jgi:hypothetical protein
LGRLVQLRERLGKLLVMAFRIVRFQLLLCIGYLALGLLQHVIRRLDGLRIGPDLGLLKGMLGVLCVQNRLLGTLDGMLLRLLVLVCFCHGKNLLCECFNV